MTRGRENALRRVWGLGRAVGVWKHDEVFDSGVPPVVADDQGNALVFFVRGVEGAPPGDAPLSAALVALWHRGRVLMVFDRFRQGWELPGGYIEDGESPREAAVRELLEESGHSASRPLRFVGYAGFVLAPDQRREYAALFAGHTTDCRDFRANEEIAAIRWWDLRQTLPGRTQPLDAYLARLTREPGSYISRPSQRG